MEFGTSSGWHDQSGRASSDALASVDYRVVFVARDKLQQVCQATEYAARAWSDPLDLRSSIPGLIAADLELHADQPDGLTTGVIVRLVESDGGPRILDPVMVDLGGFDRDLLDDVLGSLVGDSRLRYEVRHVTSGEQPSAFDATESGLRLTKRYCGCAQLAADNLARLARSLTHDDDLRLGEWDLLSCSVAISNVVDAAPTLVQSLLESDIDIQSGMSEMLSSLSDNLPRVFTPSSLLTQISRRVEIARLKVRDIRAIDDVMASLPHEFNVGVSHGRAAAQVALDDVGRRAELLAIDRSLIVTIDRVGEVWDEFSWWDDPIGVGQLFPGFTRFVIQEVDDCDKTTGYRRLQVHPDGFPSLVKDVEVGRDIEVSGFGLLLLPVLSAGPVKYATREADPRWFSERTELVASAADENGSYSLGEFTHLCQSVEQQECSEMIARFESLAVTLEDLLSHFDVARQRLGEPHLDAIQVWMGARSPLRDRADVFAHAYSNLSRTSERLARLANRYGDVRALAQSSDRVSDTDATMNGIYVASFVDVVDRVTRLLMFTD
jgi:hypothetical protein